MSRKKHVNNRLLVIFILAIASWALYSLCNGLVSAGLEKLGDLTGWGWLYNELWQNAIVVIVILTCFFIATKKLVINKIING